VFKIHVRDILVYNPADKEQLGSDKETSSFNHAAYSYKLTCQRLNSLLLFSSVSFTTEPTID
jgi:hypothetical protein